MLTASVRRRLRVRTELYETSADIEVELERPEAPGKVAQLSLKKAVATLRTGAYFSVELPVACFFKLASMCHSYKLDPDDNGKKY